MKDNILFIGAGDFGRRIAIELSQICECMGDDIPVDHLLIHSYPLPKTTCFGVADQFIILAGAIDDLCWQEARNILHKSRPYLLVTIGASAAGVAAVDVFPPFAAECLIFPDQCLVDPVAVAQLVLQIIFIHTPWNVCQRGSLAGYDLADTKNYFGGKVTKVIKMVANEEHCQQSFLAFIGKYKAALNRADSILLSLWGRTDVLSIRDVRELSEEVQQLIMPAATFLFTCHILPEGQTDFMATLFIALRGE